MPRRPRNPTANVVHHVTARGNRRHDIFLSEGDRRCFLLLLERVMRSRRWTCLAYCLMANHYHLLVETTATDLPNGMQELNGRYAQLFNYWHGFDGHLFQGRFYSSPVETDGHLLELVRYVSLNPVRAGVCDDPADWRWSSYPALAGYVRPARFLAAEKVLSLFGPEGRVAHAAFRRFVLEETRPAMGTL